MIPEAGGAQGVRIGTGSRPFRRRLKMGTIGIIGGIGPESTVEYYRLIISLYREQRGGGNPSILINSIDVKRLLDLMGANELQEATRYLVEEVEKLARAGADVGLLAANTPHVVFDGVQSGSTIPLISIVEETCDEAARMGLRRVGLFGTKFTMRGGFYEKVFDRRAIKIVTPDADAHVRWGGPEDQSARLPDSAFPRPESDRRIAVILHPPPELPTNPINDIFLSCVGN